MTLDRPDEDQRGHRYRDSRARCARARQGREAGSCAGGVKRRLLRLVTFVPILGRVAVCPRGA